MAGKRIPSIDDQLKLFKDVIARTSGKPITETNFVYINNIAVCNITIKNKTYGLFISIDQNLWLKILDDPEIKMSEIDISNPENTLMISKISMVSNITHSSWVDIDGTELFNGLIIKIRPENFDYDISLNKNLIPVKLKKSEYKDISYSIFSNNQSFMVAFRKEFKFEIDNCGFSVMRLFQVM